MGSEIPNHLLLVMIRSLTLDGDPELKKDVLQHLLRMFIFVDLKKKFTTFLNLDFFKYL